MIAATNIMFVGMVLVMVFSPINNQYYVSGRIVVVVTENFHPSFYISSLSLSVEFSIFLSFFFSFFGFFCIKEVKIFIWKEPC